MEFWDILYIECRKKKISPNKLAENLKLSNATMSRYKKGSLPNSDSLILIADYFGVSCDYLLGRSGPDPILPEDEKQLLNNYRKATEEAKKIVQGVLKESAEANEKPTEKENAS